MRIDLLAADLTELRRRAAAAGFPKAAHAIDGVAKILQWEAADKPARVRRQPVDMRAPKTGKFAGFVRVRS